MRIKIALLFISLALFHQSCEESMGEVYPNLIEKFPNTLDVSGIPAKPKDRSVYSFSDWGAWHSYSLNPKPSGGFVGPFLMTDDNGLWASQQLVTLNLRVNGELLSWSKATLLESSYLPGRLVQSYQIDSLKVTQRLIFISNRSTLVQYEIMSMSKLPKVEADFEGKTWLDGWEFSEKNGDLSMNSEQSRTQLLITFGDGFKIQPEGQSFSTSKLEFQLNSNFPLKISYIQSAYFTAGEMAAEKEMIEKSKANPAWCLANNKKRWNGYLQNTLVRKNRVAIDSSLNFLAVKSLNTLVNNWRSAAGELKHDGFFPSYAYGGFHGFWAWDSWKHSVGIADILPELAKDQILAMYDYQDVDGMIADCIFRDTLIENHNWRDTKPPLSGWAIMKVFESTRDTAFVQGLFPKLQKYHNWWYEFRDHDNNGLCEYGSTDGTRIAAAWESGMDNAVRFDEAEMLTNLDGGYSLNQESVDLNAYLYAEKLYLSQLARVLGKNEASRQYADDAEALADQVREKFFDGDEGYFFDVMLDGRNITIYGPEGWLPLWSGIATSEQARQVADKVLNESKFNTKVPLPTLDASHEKFNPKNGYWRGPVWLDQVYFGIRGMEKYGYKKEADQLTNKLFQNAEGLLTAAPIRENYHPVTGEGLNANHFSWSAAHLLLLIRE